MDRALANQRTPTTLESGGAGFTHYCLHCLTAATAEAAQCRACDAPFTGAGRFDRIAGPPPSPVFWRLFQRPRTEAQARPTPERTTLLALVDSLGRRGLGEAELVDVATELVDSGQVVLTGNFAGRRLSDGMGVGHA